MQVTIGGETKYIPVTTVTLQPVQDGATFPFHCIVCGSSQSVIGGNVVKISPILEPTNQIPVITPCKSCKTKYTFQDDVNGNVPKAIHILLNPIKEKRAFYCAYGNFNKILEYEKGYVYSFIEKRYIKLPLLSKCINNECEIIYQFTQLS